MALDLYTQEQIRHTLIATCLTAISTAQANGMTNVEHMRGVLDCARAQAAAYGLSWPSVINALRTAGLGLVEPVDIKLTIGNDRKGDDHTRTRALEF